MAVRHHDRLPLPVRPHHDRALGPRGRLPHRVDQEAQPGDAPADEVLRQALHDQLRPGPGHRHRPGVPVRDELVRLQPLRRGHLRRPAGHRGPARVLPRVDLPRPVDLRLGPHPGEAPCQLHVGGPHRHPALGVLHPRRQLVHAEPGRLPLQPGVRPRGADRLHGRDDQQGAAGHLPARRHGGLHGRRRRRHGRRPLAHAAQDGRRRPVDVPQGHPPRSRRDPRGRPRRRRHRRRPGQDHDRGPAHEDGRGRGALRVVRQQRAVLDLHRRLPRRQRGEVRRDRARACCPSSRPAPSTARSRASTSSRRSTPRSTARAATRWSRTRPTCRTSRCPTGPSAS